MHKNIKVLRKKAGFKSAEKAAQALDCSKAMLYAIEEGRRRPSIELARRMTKVFNCSFDDIFMPFSITESNNLVSKTY